MQWSDIWEIICETLSAVWEWLGEHFVQLVTVVVLVAVAVLIGSTIADGITNEQNAIASGVIVDKGVAGGSTYFDSNGRAVHDPDKYWFTISGEKDGKEVRYTFRVDADTYAAYKIGEVYHR